MSDEWVMVPREPTEAMFSASSFQEWDTFEQEWRAMLYAAPAAPQQAEPVTVLPDGSAFFTASMPLPDDHWIFAPRGEWDNDRDCCAEIPLPILTHAHRDAVTAAIRYAVRGATDCGAAMDFDPDALVQNAVYALCGPFSKPKPPQEQAGPAQPAPWPVEPDRLVPLVDLQWAWANADQGAQTGAIIRCLVNEARILRERVGHTPAAAPQRLDVKSAVASTACPYLAFPDHVCNKCGRIHGYSHPPADEVQQAEPEYWIATDGGDMIAAFSRKEAWADFCDEVSPLEAFPVYRHPPPTEAQAEPVAWAVFDPSGEVVYAALYKIRCVEYADNEYRYGHSAAKNWVVRPVFAHPTAAEVQRLRDALKPFAAIDLTTNQAVDAMDVLRARRALEGK